MTPLDMSVFVAKFVEEARDRVKGLGTALLQLEQTPGATDVIGQAMREAHSIKGSAMMLGFSDVSEISHGLEDLFLAARKNPLLLDASAFDVVLGAVDQMSGRVEQLARGEMGAIEVGPTCARLAALLAPPEKRGREPFSDAAGEKGSRPLFSDTAAVMKADRRVTKAREAPQMLRVPIEKLNRLAHLAPEMVVQSLNAFERHTELRRVERVLSRLRDRVREARITPESHLDRDEQLAEYADALDAITRRMREFLVNFSDDRVRLNLITEELRQSVIELTMLPVGSVFDGFPRAVRDLARTFGKEIEIVVRGRETELDKKIIEQISEPLIHLIRNAVDHGIEAPADRERAGKPALGRLVLSAEQQGNRILVVLKDDGRGLDPELLRAAAIRRRVATARDIGSWTNEQLFELIFDPGFSTRTETTDVSGRGVGMDVVKSVVERLGGAVRVVSELGKGTTITLNLPLSLALLRVVLLEAGDELFALPTAAVRSTLHVYPDEHDRLQDDFVSDQQQEDGHVVVPTPFATLSSLLQVPAAPSPVRQTVLITEASAGRYGIIVDAVHEEQELVFKELRGLLRHQKAFTGAALLGNGDIVPILDVNALFELASRGCVEAPAVERGPEPRVRRVLVVDDSLVAGELQKNILLAAGYQSEIAGDGVEALECLRNKEWDLVIADVDMPRMTGFELTEHIRADARFREIPVIIVTSRDTTDDRRRGFSVGADAYVLKREFDQTQLLTTVERLIGRSQVRGSHV